MKSSSKIRKLRVRIGGIRKFQLFSNLKYKMKNNIDIILVVLRENQNF